MNKSCEYKAGRGILTCPLAPSVYLAGYRLTLVIILLAGAYPDLAWPHPNLLGRGGGKEVVLLRREIV